MSGKRRDQLQSALGPARSEITTTALDRVLDTTPKDSWVHIEALIGDIVAKYRGLYLARRLTILQWKLVEPSWSSEDAIYDVDV